MATTLAPPRNHALPLAAATLLLAALGLTGCVAPPAPTEVSPEQAPPVENVPVDRAHNAYVTKPIVEGTELLCFSKGNYGSTSCNWELWNKTREAGQ